MPVMGCLWPVVGGRARVVQCSKQLGWYRDVVCRAERRRGMR